MDKWVVNNYIVQMRGGVKQARVHVLSKLVREVRRLDTKKGTDQQKEKHHRKAERLKQEILLTKKLDLNEISRYALLSTESTSEMLNKVSLPLEERAKVRLAAHKSIAGQVDIFRAKYPDWALKLPPLLVQLGLRNKYKKKSFGNQNNSGITSKSNKTESSEKNKTCNESSDENTENKSCLNNQINSDIEDDSVDRKKEIKKYRPTAITGNHSCVDNQINSDVVGGSTDSEKEEKANSEIRKLSEEFERKKSGCIAEVRRFADLLKSEKHLENPENSESESSSEENEVTNSVADPFFLTGDGSSESGDDCDSNREEEHRIKSYSGNSGSFFARSDNKLDRTNVFERSQYPNFTRNFSNRQRFSEVDQKVPTMNRRQRRLMERLQTEKKGSATSVQAGKLFPSIFEPSKKKAFIHQPKQANFHPGDSAEKQEILHPSWEAKRKQRLQQIVAFQGKKIKFDDD